MNAASRRVLGNKDTNTHLATSPKHNSKPKASLPGSSLQHPTMSAQQRSPPSTGSKRKIEEVEAAERVEQDIDASQRTQLLSDSESEHDQVNTSGTTRGITSCDTVDTSFSASQQYAGSQTVPDLHFELPQEEMSQRSRDQLGAVPMPQNTSQLPPNRPSLHNEFSAGSVGLSTFLNLDDQLSSQASTADQTHALEDVRKAKELEQGLSETNPSSVAKEDTFRPSILQENSKASTSPMDARKETISLAMEQMKARLQLALFKVQSNQTKVPFSRLKRPRPDTSAQARSSPPQTSTFIQPQPPSQKNHHHSSSTVKAPSSARTISASQSLSAAEAYVSDMRNRATAQSKPAVPDLATIPHPVIKPTAFSARWTNVPQGTFQQPSHQPRSQDKDTSDHSSHATQQHFPSSPPLSRHSSSNNATDAGKEEFDSEGVVHHAQISKARQADETSRLSSPPISDGGGKALGTKDGVTAQDITATAGEAASGLLALMQG